MSQFDVYRYSPRGSAFQYVVDVQHASLVDLKTRVVVPAYPIERQSHVTTRLNPVVSIERQRYALAVQELASLRLSSLGEPVGSLADQRADIFAALDLLLTGI